MSIPLHPLDKMRPDAYAMPMESEDTHIQTLNIANAALPHFDYEDSKKRSYLTFRMTGFSHAESIKYAKVKGPTVYSWRKSDANFDTFCRTSIFELRKKFAKEVVSLEFSRNMKLAMEVDHKILTKALTHGHANLSDDEKEYLLRIRSLYTPQALQTLEGLFGDLGDKGWDELIIMAKRTVPNAQAGQDPQGSSQASQQVYTLTSGSE